MRQSLFDPHTIKYRHQNARLLAKASSLAYQSPDVIKPEVVQWGFPQFTFIDRKDSQAFMAGNAEMIIIAFRGTEPTSLQDWMTDVKIRRKPWSLWQSSSWILKRLSSCVAGNSQCDKKLANTGSIPLVDWA